MKYTRAWEIAETARGHIEATTTNRFYEGVSREAALAAALVPEHRKDLAILAMEQAFEMNKVEVSPW